MCAWAENTMGLHYIMHWVGTVDRHGYPSQQKGTICDACGPYPSIWHTMKPVFHRIWLIHCVYESLRCLYLLRYGDFCAHDDNGNDKDMTDYFTLCTCARGKYMYLISPHTSMETFRYTWTSYVKKNAISQSFYFPGMTTLTTYLGLIINPLHFGVCLSVACLFCVIRTAI